MKRYARETLSAPSELGITDEKFRTLLSLKLLGKPALKAIAAHDGLSASAQCIMLDRLVADGFAAREQDVADRRRVIYSLTGKGREMLNNEIERRTDLLADQLALLAKRDREKLAVAVETLIDGLVRLRADKP